jgi:hypothetical protein
VKGGVYLYFGDVMSGGGTRLTHGSFEDLKQLGVVPKEGMQLVFYDYDADDENRPTYLCADGVLRFDEKQHTWEAFVEPCSFRSVPRPEADES